MIQSIKSILSSIFLETSFQKNEDVFDFQDLTNHFSHEIGILYLDGIYVGSKYGDISHFLELYKYHSHRQYANYFVDILANVVEESGCIGQDRVIGIVPVPMHWTRYTERGFNHIDKLSTLLAKKINIRHYSCLKTYFTKKQSKLSKKSRIDNRKDSIYVSGKTIFPEEVILIDDIISTGSTANACAKILKDNGVKKVIGIFIASNQ